VICCDFEFSKTLVWCAKNTTVTWIHPFWVGVFSIPKFQFHLVQAKVVMMPCVLRRQTMGGDVPLFQIVGFVVRVSGVRRHG